MAVEALCVVFQTITAVLIPALFIFRFFISFDFAELLFILFLIYNTHLHVLYSELNFQALGRIFPSNQNRKILPTNTRKENFNGSSNLKSCSIPRSYPRVFVTPLQFPFIKNRYSKIKTCHNLPTLYCIPQSSLPPNRDFFIWVCVPHPNVETDYKRKVVCTEQIFYLG